MQDGEGVKLQVPTRGKQIVLVHNTVQTVGREGGNMMSCGVAAPDGIIELVVDTTRMTFLKSRRTTFRKGVLRLGWI